MRKNAGLLSLLLGLGLVVFIDGTANAVSTDATTNDVSKRYPANLPAGNNSVPRQYCCTAYIDYTNTIYVSNKGTGYIYGGPNYTGDTYGTVYGTGTMTPSIRPFAAIKSATVRSGHSGNNADGQWINCPAGFFMVGSQYVNTKQMPSDADSADTIFCAPLRQKCGFVDQGNLNNVPDTHIFPQRSGGEDRPVSGYYSYFPANTDYTSRANGVYTSCNNELH